MVPARDRVLWPDANPFSDRRPVDLPEPIRDSRHNDNRVWQAGAGGRQRLRWFRVRRGIYARTVARAHRTTRSARWIESATAPGN